MKKKLWIVLLVFCMLMLIGRILNTPQKKLDSTPPKDDTKPAEPTVYATENTPTELVSTEDSESAANDSWDVSESDLQKIIAILTSHSDYHAEDIDLIRRGNDVLVDFNEYIIFMKDGKVIEIEVRRD